MQCNLCLGGIGFDVISDAIEKNLGGCVGQCRLVLEAFSKHVNHNV